MAALALIFSAANLFRFPHACYINGGSKLCKFECVSFNWVAYHEFLHVSSYFLARLLLLNCGVDAATDPLRNVGWTVQLQRRVGILLSP